MKEPAYKPEKWVMFQQGQVGGFGRIIGATFISPEWNYTLEGVSANAAATSVPESTIVQTFENGSWQAPSGLGGASDSAYAAPDETLAQ